MIKAQKGYVFVKTDKSAVYDDVLILGKYDKEENYIQLPIKEAKELKQKLINDLLKK